MKKRVLQMSLALLAMGFVLASCGPKKAQDGEDAQEAPQEEATEEMAPEAEGQEAPQDSAQEVSQADSPDAVGAYQCPMKCEGEKTYAQVGKCPACEMEMEEVKA